MDQELNQAAIAAYAEKGFHVVDQAFTTEELAAFDRALLRVVRSFVRQAAGGGNPFAGIDDPRREIDLATVWLEEQDHYWIRQLYHTIAEVPEFLRLPMKPGLARIAAQLLGEDPDATLYTLTKRCRIDLPGDSEFLFGWHQEVFYSIPKSDFIFLWAPLLRPSTVANGTIDVAVGSHREGIAPQTWNMRDGVPNQILVRDDVIARHPVEPVLLQPGQVLLFDRRLAHRSGQNSSGTTRFSMVSSFHRIDAEDFQAACFSSRYLGLQPQQYYLSLLGGKVAAGSDLTPVHS